jgi:hypothetical protein
LGGDGHRTKESKTTTEQNKICYDKSWNFECNEADGRGMLTENSAFLWPQEGGIQINA